MGRRNRHNIAQARRIYEQEQESIAHMRAITVRHICPSAGCGAAVEEPGLCLICRHEGPPPQPEARERRFEIAVRCTGGYVWEIRDADTRQIVADGWAETGPAARREATAWARARGRIIL